MRLQNILHLLLKPQLVLVGFLVLLSTACAAVEPAPEPVVEAPTTATTQENTAWTERARDVLMNAISYTGIQYKYGGNSPETGFDCSGFVAYVFKQTINLTLPHSALALSQIGKVIPKTELQAGDLVFFKTIKNTISHVGIYLGDNRFIHAPNTNGAVRIESMSEGYWAQRFSGAKRLDKEAHTAQQSQ
jgi:cell wall-associated NlpC family hydrolase